MKKTIMKNKIMKSKIYFTKKNNEIIQKGIIWIFCMTLFFYAWLITEFLRIDYTDLYHYNPVRLDKRVSTEQKWNRDIRDHEEIKSRDKDEHSEKQIQTENSLEIKKQEDITNQIIESNKIEETDPNEFSVLCRIVQAEAGGEDFEGKQMVANVIMNRVNSSQFPDTIENVVFQKENGIVQFSPVADGRYYEVDISEDTVNAVKSALSGEDLSEGALYFVSPKLADPSNYEWFENKLTYVKSHGGHYFYR